MSSAAAWLPALSGPQAEREDAVERLHALLSARCPLRGRSPTAARRGAAELDDLDDLAVQAAGDALVAILSKLHTPRRSRFITWA